MKNIRFIVIILIFGAVISSLFILLKRNNSDNRSAFSDNKLLEHEGTGLLSETTKKNISSKASKKRHRIKNNYYNHEDDFVDNSNSSKKSKAVSPILTNDFSNDELVLNDGTQNSDSEKKESEKNRNSTTNSHDNLSMFQAALGKIPARSNDFIVKLDKSIEGMELDGSGRTARVSAELLNSDLFENGAFSNVAGIWIDGLDKYKDNLIFGSLWEDYKNQFIEVPGFGHYLLKDACDTTSDEFVNLKIKVLKDALESSGNSNPELYQKLARTYAEDAGDINTAIAILDKYANAAPDYEYQKAETYRFASVNSDNPVQKSQYLDDAIEHYENLRNYSDNSDVRQWSDLRLGEAYNERGETDDAIATLEQAYWNLPEDSVPLCEHTIAYDLGNYHLDEGNYDDAIDWYDRVLHNDTFKNKRKAEVYKKKGDYDSAIRCYESVAKSKKKDVYSLSQAGILHAKNGRQDQAQNSFSRIQNRLKNSTQKRRQKIKNSSYYRELKKLVK